MPQMETAYNRVQENVVNWQNYTEDENDCKVYEIKDPDYKNKAIINH